MASGTLSDLMGWMSITCWLFAQFPQVLENARRRSCEGLALPFLLNWLLGDITNLIGCLLTHQLPFQTILAAYFVSVDFTLFSQYFYYRSQAPKAISPKLLEPTTPTLRYGHGRRTSTDHEHFRELSNAAANVAFAAAIAAEEEELHSSETHGRSAMSASMTLSKTDEAEEEVDDSALAALADSIHSETGRKHVSWSQERYGTGTGRGGSTSRTRTRPPLSPLTTIRSSFISPSPTVEAGTEILPHYTGAPGEFDASMRGRPRQRQVVDSPMGDDDDLEAQQESTLPRTLSQETIKGRRSSRASSKAVGLVFLSAWALFGMGGLPISKRSAGTNHMRHSFDSHGLVLSQPHTLSTNAPPAVPSASPPSTAYDFIIDPTLQVSSDSSLDYGNYHQQTSEPDPPSSERILGRISAWACTTLYLTSRLPQIWKNFVRRSVEGLSIYLFIFAFLGNTFYVLSILTSPMMSLPPQESMAFLKESIPYLLGSGGTLLFDVTIVIQSVIYRPNPKFGRRRATTQSTSHSRSRTNSHAAVPNAHQSTVGRHTTNSLSRRGRSLSSSRISGVYPRSRSVSLLATEQAPLLTHNKSVETHDVERGYEHGYTHSRRRKDASETDYIQGGTD